MPTVETIAILPAGGLSSCSEDSLQAGFSSPQLLAVSHVPREKGHTFQTKGLFIFPPEVTRGIRRSSQAEAVFAGLSLAFSQRPGLFWQPSQLCLLGWECFLNCSKQTPIQATQSPWFVYSPKSRNEHPVQRVGSKQLCHKQVAEGDPPGCTFFMQSEQEKQNLDHKEAFKPLFDPFQRNSAWLCASLPLPMAWKFFSSLSNNQIFFLRSNNDNAFYLRHTQHFMRQLNIISWDSQYNLERSGWITPRVYSMPWGRHSGGSECKGDMKMSENLDLWEPTVGNVYQDGTFEFLLT